MSKAQRAFGHAKLCANDRPKISRSTALALLAEIQKMKTDNDMPDHCPEAVLARLEGYLSAHAQVDLLPLRWNGKEWGF